MITPYKRDEIDFSVVDAIVDYYAVNGCNGIFAVCQSSESAYLSLREKVRLAERVIARTPHGMNVVASGHTAYSLRDQAEELNAIGKTGVDAVVLVTNRLDTHNEGDDVWIENAKKLLDMLDVDLTLGLYECPTPYKRLLTPKILDWCIETGRFKFIKDTCCCPDTLEGRLKQLEGTGIGLFNANEQTLLHSLRHGGFGYSGIMGNYHPKLLVWLCKNYLKQPEKAEKLMNLLSMCAFTENEYYPMTAKYHFNLEGIPMSLTSRTVKYPDLNAYQRFVTEQLRQLEKEIEKEWKL